MMESDVLIQKAREVQKNAYAPYSKIVVGAALLAKSGAVFTGCNVENASYGATMCAERVALYQAIAAGERDFLKIAIVSNLEDFTYPCGICRQVLSEFSPTLTIVLANEKNEIVTTTLDKLLPYAFSISRENA
jgi:cytidine deaminase